MNTSSIQNQVTHAAQWAGSGSKLIYASLAVGLVVGVILFRLFFKNVAGVFHCIGFSVGSPPKEMNAKPGVSKKSRLKLFFGALLPATSGYAAYYLLPRFFPAFFH